MKGHWPKGRRRNDLDASQFIAGLIEEHGTSAVASAIGVSPRTVRRWSRGEDWCTLETIQKLIECLIPATGSLPIYDPVMALDGNTRVAGVGDYTLNSAKGQDHDNQ